MQHVDAHLGGGELDERVAQGLYRAVHVAFHHQIELVEIALGHLVVDVVEAGELLGALLLFALQLFAARGNFAGFLLGVHHVEGVAGGGSAVQTEHQYRR